MSKTKAEKQPMVASPLGKLITGDKPLVPLFEHAEDDEGASELPHAPIEEARAIVEQVTKGLYAEYSGLLKLGDYELPCFVLNNKKRVLIMREVVHLLTGHRKGGLERYTNATGVRDYMPEKYVDQPHRESAIAFKVNNTIAYGYEANDIISICDAYLKARQEGALKGLQYGLAKQAEIFIRSCAKVGLEALIDEATGFQVIRDADELQTKLAAYISKDLNEWTRTFPVEFFDNLYRLEGQDVPVPRKAYPKRFGRYVMQFVYDTLDPQIADWLRQNNPNPRGVEHHHQWFTKEFGQPKLKFHLMEVMGIMKASTSMENFKENIARAFAEARENRRKRVSKAKVSRDTARRKAQDERTGQRTIFDEMTYL